MPRRSASNPRARAATALRRSTGALSTAAVARMEADMPWFRELSAEDRSWVALIIQAGIKGFVDWYPSDEAAAKSGGTALAASVFGAAPRALAGVITLQQTVDLVRLSIEVVESNIDAVLEPEDAPDVHAAVMRYAREVAFATAEVYARAAEARGAWDARLEALVVDAVLRAETDESVLSRASAAGWATNGRVAVVLAAMPERRTESDLFEEVRRAARAAGLEALCAVQGDRLVVLLGGVDDEKRDADLLVDLVAEGPIVVGPVTEDLSHAHLSARAALSAYRAAAGWPEAPRPVRSSDLLPERVLAGDGHARRHLIEEVYVPLMLARGTLIETLASYFATGASLEATARALFVHANTVRYRLRQVADTTGYTPAVPRDALALQMALVLGRQSGRDATSEKL
ncbi:CdaR family transcriptional regulator [Nocardioides sp. cx-173]|uniref:PucR family transcriptional regulator n=1 Tax=Nocardioides sp. cx-173 TaxID=2898796 RepID=UPI001E47D605|nr:helix-turn-helix domain-containing protein [Nocardioides sp. cx-173]MCD4527239.1 helix-turn-helix domain-containing protein [Nocardioides sp. cx-173]UGB40382.1 helix-turn-helix domain-containing protein [Nocardioides sp. cx-173]